jgi:ketosteroid isomerase-like protein
MSEENVRVVRDSLQALADEGLEAVVPFWAEDISWRAIEGAPDDVGEMRGADNITHVPVELIDVRDDRVVAVQHATGRARLSGAETELRYAVVYTVRDGRIVRGKEYLDREQALEAVGLASA